MQYNMKQFDANHAFPIPKRSRCSDLFQSFGICGTSELIGMRSPVAVSNFRLDDKVVTRKGLVRPLAIARRPKTKMSFSAQTIVSLQEGCFGEKIPQRRTVLSSGATARWYPFSIPQTVGDIVNVQDGSSDFGKHPQDCEDKDLYMVIFPERTEVQVHGIYVTCPGVSDVKEWLQDRASKIRVRA